MWTEDFVEYYLNFVKGIRKKIAAQSIEYWHCERRSMLGNNLFSQSDIGSNVSSPELTQSAAILPHDGRLRCAIHTFIFLFAFIAKGLNYKM